VAGPRKAHSRAGWTFPGSLEIRPSRCRAGRLPPPRSRGVARASLRCADNSCRPMSWRRGSLRRGRSPLLGPACLSAPLRPFVLAHSGEKACELAPDVIATVAAGPCCTSRQGWQPAWGEDPRRGASAQPPARPRRGDAQKLPHNQRARYRVSRPFPGTPTNTLPDSSGRSSVCSRDACGRSADAESIWNTPLQGVMSRAGRYASPWGVETPG